MMSRMLPLLQINRSLEVANQYREKIKFIQRVWKVKYHNRLYALLYFTDNHVNDMVREYPHLKLFHEDFYKRGVNRLIVLEYIRDESEKYRYIH